MRNRIIRLIKPFHRPFQRFIPEQLFLYGFFGSLNLALDILLYYIAFHYVVHEQVVVVAGISISPHIAAFLCAFCITFPIGFLSMRHLVFNATSARARIQILKYLAVVGMNVVLNYVLLKLFVEVFHIFPTPSKMLTAVIVVTITYLVQKRFTFKELGEK
jgi:putative flippase GtrA